MNETAPGRTPPRMLRVRRAMMLSPQMRRITLAGPALAGFPPGSDGAHIKLLLARPGQSAPVLPTLGPDGPVWPPADVRPVARTYTVARYDAEAGELDVDFVLHADAGPASAWAAAAREGDAVGVAGPGGPPRCLARADFYLMAGDPSALPAIAATLGSLPGNARGLVLVELPDSTEVQPLRYPAGITVRWLSRGARPAGPSTLLLDAVKALAWPAGLVSVTLAGESNQLVALRRFLTEERGIAREAMYAVPYWKDAHSEEDYHAERHRIMDELEEHEE